MNIKKNLPTIITLVSIIVLWEVLLNIFNIPPYLIPKPTDIVEAAYSRPINWAEHTWATLIETLLGFSIGALLGIISAITIVYSKLMEKILYPILLFAQVIPKVAVAPILVVWFGFGLAPKIAIAVVISFFPVVVNTMIGLRLLEQDLVDLAVSLRATSWQIFQKLRFPNSLPYLFGGLKISITMSLVGAIVAEFVTSQRGLGYLVNFANTFMDTPLMFVGVVILSVMGGALYLIIMIVERILMPWHVTDEEVTMTTG